jgi:hypothetical protein
MQNFWDGALGHVSGGFDDFVAIGFLEALDQFPVDWKLLLDRVERRLVHQREFKMPA